MSIMNLFRMTYVVFILMACIIGWGVLMLLAAPVDVFMWLMDKVLCRLGLITPEPGPE